MQGPVSSAATSRGSPYRRGGARELSWPDAALVVPAPMRPEIATPLRTLGVAYALACAVQAVLALAYPRDTSYSADLLVRLATNAELARLVPVGLAVVACLCTALLARHLERPAARLLAASAALVGFTAGACAVAHSACTPAIEWSASASEPMSPALWLLEVGGPHLALLLALGAAWLEAPVRPRGVRILWLVTALLAVLYVCGLALANFDDAWRGLVAPLWVLWGVHAVVFAAASWLGAQGSEGRASRSGFEMLGLAIALRYVLGFAATAAFYAELRAGGSLVTEQTFDSVLRRFTFGAAVLSVATALPITVGVVALLRVPRGSRAPLAALSGAVFLALGTACDILCAIGWNAEFSPPMTFSTAAAIPEWCARGGWLFGGAAVMSLAYATGAAASGKARAGAERAVVIVGVATMALLGLTAAFGGVGLKVPGHLGLVVHAAALPLLGLGFALACFYIVRACGHAVTGAGGAAEEPLSALEPPDLSIATDDVPDVRRARRAARHRD